MISKHQRTRTAAASSVPQSDANARQPGALYVVATPIGNLADLSPRAREILSESAVILAEDTRHTAQMLSACGVSTPLVSLHEHNEAQRVPEMIERLRSGEQLALVSDAGTPLVSDPGFRIVRAVAAAGLQVRSVPGPCAAIAALSIAGLPSDRFIFEGFLPAKATARRARLEALGGAPQTLIFYEAPHRIAETLAQLAAGLGGQRQGAVAREMTKMFESTYRGTLQELAQRALDDADLRRGEIVIVVEGAASVAADNAELQRALQILLQQLPVRQAADLAAQLTQSAPNAAYTLALTLAGRI